jgi:ArsR family transcriptional regulator
MDRPGPGPDARVQGRGPCAVRKPVVRPVAGRHRDADHEGMVNSTPVEPTVVETAVQRYGALADATRLRILAVLAARSCCVCDVQAVVDVAPNLLSYHLRVLREAGLIAAARRGRWIDYRVAPDAHAVVVAALEVAGLAPTAAPSCTSGCDADGAGR